MIPTLPCLTLSIELHPTGGWGGGQVQLFSKMLWRPRGLCDAMTKQYWVFGGAGHPWWRCPFEDLGCQGTKGVGTSPKVRGPAKLPSHLEQKQPPLGKISVQMCALLVLVNNFPYKNCFQERRERISEEFWPKSEGAMAPVAPPVPTPMQDTPNMIEIHTPGYGDRSGGLFWLALLLLYYHTLLSRT